MFFHHAWLPCLFYHARISCLFYHACMSTMFILPRSSTMFVLPCLSTMFVLPCLSTMFIPTTLVYHVYSTRLVYYVCSTMPVYHVYPTTLVYHVYSTTLVYHVCSIPCASSSTMHYSTVGVFASHCTCTYGLLFCTAAFKITDYAQESARWCPRVQGDVQESVIGYPRKRVHACMHACTMHAWWLTMPTMRPIKWRRDSVDCRTKKVTQSSDEPKEVTSSSVAEEMVKGWMPTAEPTPWNQHRDWLLTALPPDIESPISSALIFKWMFSHCRYNSIIIGLI